MKSLQDLADFVIKNRGSKVFKEIRDNDHLLHVIYAAASNHCLSFCVDEKDEVCGLALGRIDTVNKEVFFVTNILTTRPKAFSCLLNKFRAMFPNKKLEALRRGKHKVYATDKFIERVNRFTLKGVI